MEDEAVPAEPAKDDRWHPRFIELYPDARLAQAVGRPVGRIKILEQDYEVRSSTLEDLGWFQEKSGKNPLRGGINLWDLGAPFLAEVVARATIPLDGAPQLEVASLMKTGISNVPVFVEVVKCFLQVELL